MECEYTALEFQVNYLVETQDVSRNVNFRECFPPRQQIQRLGWVKSQIRYGFHRIAGLHNSKTTVRSDFEYFFWQNQSNRLSERDF